MKKKLLIVANNCPWRSWDDKILELKRWFAPKVDLDIELTHTKYSQIPFITYGNVVSDQAHIPNPEGIDYKWYDTYVSPMAQGYDIVLFVLNMSQWPSANSFRGWRVDQTLGAVELQIGVNENEMFRWGDYTGGGFFNFARHEIMHALFMITGQTDTTHKWWDQSPNMLVNALNELVFPHASDADQVSWLKWVVEFLKTLVGIQTEINRIKAEQLDAEIVSEESDRPTKREFCLAIQEMEGYYAPGEHWKYPNGSLAWRNKNPGNLKYAGQLGSIGQNKGFAVFPDYETGFAALMRQVEIACNGKSKVYSPDMMLFNASYRSPHETPFALPGFFQVFAPDSDNNDSLNYATFIAKKLGTTTAFIIKDLV